LSQVAKLQASNAHTTEKAARFMTNTNPGQMVVSVDFEMAWGLMHRNGSVAYEIENERELLAELLDAFDQHDVPATWATVGHLLLSECDSEGGTKHPEIRRPDYAWFDGDWFDTSPCSGLADAPRWYAPDVVTDILSRPANHELGCHSFSHLIVGDPATTRADFASELDACTKAAAPYGVKLESFVYPRNTVGHVDELTRHGYSSYRGQRPDQFAALGPAAKPARLVDKVWPTRRSVVRPIWESDIWNFPATCLFTVEHRRSPELWLRQTLRRMNHAARHGGLFHVWFHPHNLAAGGARSFEAFDRLLEHGAKLRSESKLEMFTMASLAEQLSEARIGGRSASG